MARRRRARQADHQAARAGDEGRRIAVREHQAKKAATSPCGVANGISRHAESPDSRRGLLFAPTWPARGRRRGSGQRGPPGGGGGETRHRGPPGGGSGETRQRGPPGNGSGETRNKSPGRKSGGTGPLSEPGQDYHVHRELHWYESHGIGRRELKIKRFV